MGQFCYNAQCVIDVFVEQMTQYLIYDAELKAMPKPSLCRKIRKGRIYEVVQYREKDKVICFRYNKDDVRCKHVGDPARRTFLRKACSKLRSLLRKAQSVLHQLGSSLEEVERLAREMLRFAKNNSSAYQQFEKLKEETAAKQNVYCEQNKIYKTERGELVRSYAELTIANELYKRKYDYIYEACLKMKDGSVLYPDFTIYNHVYNKIIYVEHVGMLDRGEYRAYWEKKREKYAENNVLEGEQLFTTYHVQNKRRERARIHKLLNCFLTM